MKLGYLRVKFGTVLKSCSHVKFNPRRIVPSQPQELTHKWICVTYSGFPSYTYLYNKAMLFKRQIKAFCSVKRHLSTICKLKKSDFLHVYIKYTHFYFCFTYYNIVEFFFFTETLNKQRHVAIFHHVRIVWTCYVFDAIQFIKSWTIEQRLYILLQFYFILSIL